MNVYEFVIIIVLVVTIGRVIERRYSSRGHASRKRNGKHAGDADSQAPGAGEIRLDSLEERVQVLERIVTDQGYELRQKFRDLEG